MIVDSCSREMIESNMLIKIKKSKCVERVKSQKSKMRSKRVCNERASWYEYERVMFDSEMRAGVKRCIYFLCVQ